MYGSMGYHRRNGRRRRIGKQKIMDKIIISIQWKITQLYMSEKPDKVALNESNAK